MPVYPIRVPRERYRGSKPGIARKVAEHNRLAAALEEYLNKWIAERDEPIQLHLYGLIAADMNLPVETVRGILFGVDCGHNGLTVRKDQAAPDGGPWA